MTRTIPSVKGPPITIGCHCGAVERVPYGEAWTCPDCGRRWDTTQIPPEQYAGIMREMRGYRIRAGLTGLAIGAVVGAAAVLSDRPIFPLALVAMAGWLLLYMPRWRRKVRARARELPRWTLRPDR